MAFTKSPGEPAPDFNLVGCDNRNYSLADFTEDIVAIVFSCNHCPYVVGSERRMKDYQSRYQGRVRLVAINSNDSVAFPDDSFEAMIVRAEQENFNFVYLRDEDQKMAAAYGAIKTPHFFLLDRDRVIRYAGRMDDNPKDESAVTTHELVDATEDLLAGRQVSLPQTESLGCTIKWKGKDRKYIPADACDVIPGLKKD